MPQLSAYILAGGRSRRFGSDKARALLRGRPLVSRLADQLKPMADRVVVVADAPGKYADLGLETIADQRPGMGPLGGLHTALSHLASQGDGDRLLLVACDWVEIRPHWIDRLWEESAGGSGIQAVAYRDIRWQPVPAIYHVSLLPLIVAQLDSGALSMQAMLDKVSSIALPLPSDWPEVAQINTPDEYRAAADALRDQP